jgi:serine phosphatase RsbU (regulator of sigma subunit)
VSTKRTSARGVGARLLLAFFGISAFSALVAGAAIYAFFEVGQSLTLIDRRIDPILASLEVSRSVEQIIHSALNLSSVNTEEARVQVFGGLSKKSTQLRSLLNGLRDGGISYDRLEPIEQEAVQLDANLAALDADVRLRLQVIAQIKNLMRGVFDTNEETQSLLSPTLLVYDSQISRLVSLMNAGQGQEPTWQSFQPLVAGLLAERQVQRVQQQSSDIADALAQASLSDKKQRLQVLAFQLRRKVGDLERGAQGLDPKLRPIFLARLDKFRTLVDGPSSVPVLRHRELDLIADAGRLLAENSTLSDRLTAAAEQLVEATKLEVRAATGSALRVQQISTNAITALVLLSLITSFVIVWLYVGRNIVARLNRLSATMLAIANGDRNSIVVVTGSDEVAAMGQAVETFRQNAIERDALLIERAETAQHLERLVEKRTKELNETVGTLKEASEVIASSIQYASRIQRSILPESTLVQSTLSDHFILWEPRDVVSGDVYWFSRWGDGLLIILGDCTGHGVPGAFVTLIANSALERSLLDVDPGAVGMLISRMNQLIKSSLKQVERGGESDDGMDLGICYIPADHTRLRFAGAGISLFSAAPGEELVETRGNKRGIGYRRVPFDQTYSETDLPLVPSMRFYMTSDGVIDQIGGERHRAFGLTRLLTLLNHQRDESMSIQKNVLKSALSEYQDQEIRRDDVLVLGFRHNGVSAV